MTQLRRKIMSGDRMNDDHLYPIPAGHGAKALCDVINKVMSSIVTVIGNCQNWQNVIVIDTYSIDWSIDEIIKSKQYLLIIDPILFGHM